MKIFPYMRTMSDPEKDCGVCFWWGGNDLLSMRLASKKNLALITHLLNNYCVDKDRHVWRNFVLMETRWQCFNKVWPCTLFCLIFKEIHLLNLVNLKSKFTQVHPAIPRRTAGKQNVLCLIKAVLRTSWWNQCFAFFLTFLFLTDLLSSGVRSKVVKGQRTYRLFAGAWCFIFVIYYFTL